MIKLCAFEYLIVGIGLEISLNTGHNDCSDEIADYEITEHRILQALKA